MKIIVDEQIPYIKGVFENVADVKYLQGNLITKSDVFDADALLIRTRTKCNKALLECSSVKMVASATIGIDHIDILWLERAGIKWSNAPGCNSGAVCQYVTSVLSLLINEGLKPSETTIGIVGVGMVGSKVEKFAKMLGFKVLLNDPPRERKELNSSFVSLQTVLKEADIITFHTPLTYSGINATYHLFDVNSLNMLKPDTVIINTSRGKVINSDALLKGVETGKISKIVLDVWENESDISTELLNKVWIATPHIAGYSIEGSANGTIMAVQSISKFFNLGLDEWKPELPPPSATPHKEGWKNSEETEDKEFYKVIADAVLKTYNVLNDDAILRKNPADFEKIRDNYTMRRELCGLV